MMVIHPNIQARAHAEIDGVTKGSRLPEFSDQPELPFVKAVLAELLRCYPPAPLGINSLLSPLARYSVRALVGLAHASVNDDVYDGQFIPAGGLPSDLARRAFPVSLIGHQARPLSQTFGELLHHIEAKTRLEVYR